MQLSPPTGSAPAFGKTLEVYRSMPNQHVLIIDDEEMVRSTISSALSYAGYAPVSAGTIHEAFERIEDSLPDLIISDIYMTDGNGFEVLSRIRKQPETVTTPFLLMTGRFEPKIMRRGMEMGADDFILKPFSPKQLVASIDARLNRVEQYPDEDPSDPRKLAEIVNHLPILIGTCDRRASAMTFLNETGYSMLHIDPHVPADSIALPEILQPINGEPDFAAILEQAARGVPWTGAYLLRPSQGQHLTVHLQITPHAGEGGTVDYVSVLAHETPKSSRKRTKI